MAYWIRVGMNHEKDQNLPSGCSFKANVGQLGGSVFVCGPCRKNGACVGDSMFGKIKISRLMRSKLCLLFCCCYPFGVCEDEYVRL